MTTLSDEIKNARYGAVANPYQGNDKKVLFVCTMGILRSATGARIYASKYNTRSAGTDLEEALIPVTQTLLDWADEVVFVNPKNYGDLVGKFKLPDNIKVLNIPDDYPHMDKEIIAAFSEQYEQVPRAYNYALRINLTDA
jgi:predicted protein tyrosine phosphatase